MIDVETAQADVECHDLVRIYATKGIEVQALQGLNLHMARGEMTALVGASGSGKSTLLNILSGIDTPTAGTAQVAGVELTNLRRGRRVAYQRHSVGFVWQQTSRNLLPFLTAEENVTLPLALSGAKHRRARARELLDLLGTSDLAARRPAELSGGQQQRVAVAVAIANSPRVLLADEPTGELDEDTSADVLNAIREVNEHTGITTLIVTHDPTVSEHVRRTVQIRDGRTSTEVLRRTERGEGGNEEMFSEEFAVLDKAGRLQLPEEFITTLNMRERVRLALEADHVGVFPSAPTSLDGEPHEHRVTDSPVDPEENE